MKHSASHDPKIILKLKKKIISGSQANSSFPIEFYDLCHIVIEYRPNFVFLISSGSLYSLLLSSSYILYPKIVLIMWKGENIWKKRISINIKWNTWNGGGIGIWYVRLTLHILVLFFLSFEEINNESHCECLNAVHMSR